MNQATKAVCCLPSFLLRGALMLSMAVMLLGSSGTQASAQDGTIAGGLLGAGAGAIIGGATGGGKGAARGAIAGGVIGGVLGTAAENRRRRYAPPPQANYYAPPPSSPLVYDTQASLYRLGYNPGPVDGQYGRLTGDAIAAYQYDHRLPVTGQPSERLLNHMIRRGG